MSTTWIEREPLTTHTTDDDIPPLEPGDCLNATEFLRRSAAMPELKKAELINGVVYMSAAVRVDQHAEPDSFIQGLLFFYASHTRGVRSLTNGTVRLNPDDVVQPDAALRILAELGGQSRIGQDGYLRGAPELAAEVSASTVSIDARQKLQAYRQAGVREYLLWRVRDKAVDWWTRDADDEFQPILADTDGLHRSRVFPGLWLDVNALLAEDGVRLIEVLQNGLRSTEHGAFVETLKPAS
ncbi:MAG: Uma2 family endonuclease [Planctomycetaceae bacterium]